MSAMAAAAGAAPDSFSAIGIANGPAGRARLDAATFEWRPDDAGAAARVKVHLSELATASWTPVGPRKGSVRFNLRDGRDFHFDGFGARDHDKIKAKLSQADVPLTALEVNATGMNWGRTHFEGTTLALDIDKKPGFEVDLKDISQCVLSGMQTATRAQRDVALSFPENEDGDGDGDEHQLVELKVWVPDGHLHLDGELDADVDADATPAQKFQQQVMDLAKVQKVTGNILAEFPSDVGTFLLPRGKFAVEMYEKTFRMVGNQYDYKIKYDDINRFFLLGRPDGRFAFVICLDRPLRQGQQRYSHLVWQAQAYDSECTINLTPEQIAAQYPGGQLHPRMTGQSHTLIAKVFKGLSGKKVFVPGKFFSHASTEHMPLKCVSCSIKAATGLLYPLEKTFVFIHKPTLVIRFEEVESVEFKRYGGAQGAPTRMFDLEIKCKRSGGEDGKEFEFTGIDRNEYTGLVEFIQSKKMPIRNLKASSAAAASADAGGSSGGRRRNQQAMHDGSDGDSDDDEEDGDFGNSDASSSSGSDSDSDSDGSVQMVEEGEDSVGHGMAAADSPKKKKRKAPAAPKAAKAKAPAGKKKKAKKDPNAPKKPISSYFYFASAKRAEVKESLPEDARGIADIGRKTGELWRGMDDDAKAPYAAKAATDKARYATEMETYVPPPAESDDSDDEPAKPKPKAKKQKKAAAAPAPAEESSSSSSDDDDDDDHGPVAKVTLGGAAGRASRSGGDAEMVSGLPSGSDASEVGSDDDSE